MDEQETKPCPNCKREIPAVNFTIHSVHCARNIKICPVCKEPVPQSELQEHHEKLHKLLPCKKCGERVCGTDLEDHVRDSCAHTIKSCRYCELELPRRELPAHEGYCGVRTEQCPDCREWVMIKYRQLHLDSNHGFVRLQEDPAPQPMKEPVKMNKISKPASRAAGPAPAPACSPFSLFNGPSTSAETNGFVKNTNVDRPRTVIRPIGPPSSAQSASASSSSSASNASNASSASSASNKLPLKRTNDQPQINTSVDATDKVAKDLGISRGAVKKRPAPKPPALPSPEPRRDMPYYSALQRQQHEERQRQEQTAINLAQGLPPVLSPLAKLERLRKLDALQARAEPRRPPRTDHCHLSHEQRNDLKNLKPMSPEEFMQRFTALQVGRGPEARGGGGGGGPGGGGDRFSEIKSSLRELRRGLNEVTAPYNSNSTNNEPAVERNSRHATEAQESSGSSESDDEEHVRLPCEFCDRLVPVDDLVQHQTGCRPDLAQLRPRDWDCPQPPRRNRQQQQLQQQQQQQQQQIQQNNFVNLPPHPDDLPVIPCEFCTESLPVYLIQEHQERCRRDGNMLYAD